MKEIIHILEVFVMSTLIAGHRDGLRVFLYRGIYHFFNAAVMAKMNYLNTRSLNYPSHDINGGVMTIEQAGSRDEADLVRGTVIGKRLEFGVRRPDRDCRAQVLPSGVPSFVRTRNRSNP